MEWKQLLMMCGGAAGVAAVLWYLLKDEEQSARSTSEGERSRREMSPPAAAKAASGELSLPQVQKLLSDILKSQNVMKDAMKDLTSQYLAESLSFEQLYHKVSTVQPDDPLERLGLDTADFEKLIDKHQEDAVVKDAIQRIMGHSAGAAGQPSGRVKLSKAKVVEVHKFMISELEKVVAHIAGVPSKATFNPKTTTITAQAVISAKVEEKYSVTSDDIEAAVLIHQGELLTDKVFMDINVKMQQAMGKIQVLLEG